MVKKKLTSGKINELKINRRHVQEALEWLCEFNHLYRGKIQIDNEMLKTLPEDGYLEGPDLVTIETEEDESDEERPFIGPMPMPKQS